MKLILFLFLAICTYAKAGAQSSSAPKWMSQKGFWVIQGNVNAPKNSTVYFYNNERVLVYKEQVTGKRINPNKLKVRKHLESVLNQSVVAWEKEHMLKENQQLLVTRP